MKTVNSIPKKSLAIIVGLLISFHNFCQPADTLFNFKRIPKDSIKLPQPEKIGNIAINSIAVADMRYDTTVIGFNKLNAIALGNSASTETRKHLNASFVLDTTSQNSVVLYMKTFWLGNQLGVYGASAGMDRGKWKQGMICKMECFYKQQDTYFALFRYDTTLLAAGKLEDDAVDLITTCLKRVSQKIASSVATFHTGKTKMTGDEISKYYLDRFNVPVLKDTMLKKGIYTTFAEFKSNQPSYSNYQIETDKIADLLYKIDSAGKPELVRTIWGYCDGKRAFILSEDNYFPLQRVGNSFYLNGFKDVEVWMTTGIGMPLSIANQTTGEEKYKNRVPTRGKKFVKHKVFYKPYQLNMENGEIY